MLPLDVGQKHITHVLRLHAARRPELLRLLLRLLRLLRLPLERRQRQQRADLREHAAKQGTKMQFFKIGLLN